MKRSLILASLVLLSAAATARAQTPFAVEVRAGGAFPTQDLDETALKTGMGAAATLSFAVMPHIRIYGGWDYFQMQTDGAFAGAEFDVVDTGYEFGLQFQHPMLNRMDGWIRLGGLYNHIELEDDDGVVADSGHELGFDVGAGLRVPLTEKLALTPGVRYRGYGADLEVGGQTIPVDLNYVAAELGLSWSFGAPDPRYVARR